MDDLISRGDAIKAVLVSNFSACTVFGRSEEGMATAKELIQVIKNLPSVQPTLYGYNIEHLELIARVLQKEDLPPDRVAEALTDIGRIVAIVKDELEEALKKEMWEYGRDRLD